MRWVALMPLRGGSKSIPGKNLRPLAGRPLFAWSLEQALVSDCFDAVYVATDAPAIADAVTRAFGSEVTVLDRSPETATDSASSESVLLEFQQRVPFDVVGLIQATSPLTRADDFRQAKARFLAENLDSLLTAVEFKRFLWRPDATAINYDPGARPRRQDFDGCLMENGAFYLTRSEILRRFGNRLGGHIGIHTMNANTALEIDDPSDWDMAEQLLLGQPRTVKTVARALITDVDGTLTDGGMYYDARGEAMKKFHTRDAHGLQRLREQGLKVAVISGETSASVAARVAKLQLTDYYPGVTDKLKLLHDLAQKWKLELDEIAYIGDDLSDLACILNVGHAFCPRDAAPEIRARAHHVCAYPGGAGAVREACDLLLKQSGNNR
ncbi:MAG: phosphatase [Gammaproteobacteria bacterium HGW-Gammaproteobacteria-3]|nr:MAG: phosphatase [Gammaproteobacteria bacterium HGW-Gammaproteobacteria-3]